MAVSSVAGTRLTIREMCYQAYVGIGLRNSNQGTDDKQWEADFRFAKTRLDLIINGLPTVGPIARVKSYEDVALTVGVSEYDMPAGVVDIIGDAMYIEPGQDVNAASGETLVKMINSSQWQQYSDKGSQGRPHLFYPHRENDVIQVRLRQTPDEAGTIRFLCSRKLADTFDGNATIDLQEYWDRAIVTSLEAELAKANSMPLALIQDRRMEADRLMELAVAKGNERESNDAVIMHRTGWNRRAMR